MSRTRGTVLDAALIIGGAGLSILFISTGGNGQNPLRVAAGMLLVVGVTGAVSFALAWFVRTLPLAVVASMGVTELVFVLYFVGRVAFSAHVDDHASEELYLLPIVFAVVTAPAILLSSIGFGRVASRIYQKRGAEPCAPPNDVPAESSGGSDASASDGGELKR